MNYIGSKNKLSPWIEEVIQNHVPGRLDDKIFCDLFAGTGIVGRRFKTKVAAVIANDVEYYSFVLLKNYIENHSALEKTNTYIDELNALSGKNGFIADQYGKNGSAKRQFFSQENAEKIDACRQQIGRWKEANEINGHLFYFLLASLLESADKVANTASVYGAFLKKVKASARKPLVIQPADFEKTPASHRVFQRDANALIRDIKGDILYLDPPYNARQYGANYHLLNTIARYRPFTPKGKTGLPNYYKSDYCRKNQVEESLADLIEHADFKYIFLSYNNEGLLPLERIESIFKKYGQYQIETKAYQRFKADNKRAAKATGTTEYIHILKKP